MRFRQQVWRGQRPRSLCDWSEQDAGLPGLRPAEGGRLHAHPSLQAPPKVGFVPEIPSQGEENFSRGK